MALNGHKAVHQLFHRAVLRVGVGINWAGLDDVDRDAARAKIPRQAARQPLQGRFAERIGRHSRHWHAIAIDRADDNNAPAFRHAARRFDGGMVGGVNIDAEQAIDGIAVLLESVTEKRDPGIDH